MFFSMPSWGHEQAANPFSPGSASGSGGKRPSISLFIWGNASSCTRFAFEFGFQQIRFLWQRPSDENSAGVTGWFPWVIFQFMQPFDAIANRRSEPCLLILLWRLSLKCWRRYLTADDTHGLWTADVAVLRFATDYMLQQSYFPGQADVRGYSNWH